MDVSLLFQHSQYALPVGIVLICAILVFVFGFKKAEQPPFAQLSVGSDVDRKFTNKKRIKIKEKVSTIQKSANGQIVIEKTSPIKKSISTKTEVSKKVVSKPNDTEGKLKERKQEDNKISITKKDKDQVLIKVGKENKIEQVKNKKNLKNLFQEKPIDFDEGDWEQAYSKKDKKNKKKEEESPSKKNKKNTKKIDLINEEVIKQKVSEKVEIKDKIIKETENKELKEKDKKDVILTPISNEEISKEKEQQKEEQSKNEKIEKEEKKSGKSKKGKKISENENIPIMIVSTPKVDNKIQEQRTKKKDDNIEKELDNFEEKNPNVMQTQEKSGPVFDELGVLLGFISVCTAVGAWHWLTDPNTPAVSFTQSLCNHPFFAIASIILVILFMMGVHRRVIAPSIITQRARSVLSNFNMSCDDTGKLILKPTRSRHHEN
ncbi:Transmembrane protein [Apis cerana cerana]|uniref:Transmembrane protein 188 n=1 Tax=Apis cerana cerana TaxID=94128 RepID=A0A2A3EE74_APICC|nr:Transmembrane protein [Apis cerana cerana]